MGRRAFITLLGGATVAGAWPLAARAQQRSIPVIGFLRSTLQSSSMHLVAAFRAGLKEAGFVEGQNVAVEFLWGEDRPDRLPALVTELIRRPVAVIVGDTPTTLAAKAATATVPIVFASGSDPVRDGLVASLNRPGGNVTGVNFFNSMLGSKRLDLLHQLVPKAGIIGMLVNAGSANTEAERRDVEAAAKTIGKQLVMVDVRNEREIDDAFAILVQRGAEALYVGAGAFLNGRREQVVALAARHAIPAIYAQREATLAGGLFSYGPSITDAYRQAGVYVGRILKGAKPADLPVMRSTRFEFMINLKTAKTLGLEFHPQLLALADEVVE
jgi:putative tryptophan/tyrosine transport system substrate-binding protein